MSASTPLDHLADLARHLGADEIGAEAADAARRLADRRFFVACVGQFKRGKSSLLNALVGGAVLPVGVAPVTSVVTVLRAGDAPAASVRWRDGRQESVALASLADYVDERRNPGNAKGVAAIEVFLPSPILQDGLCLVDTPGVGSVFGANTEATRAFIPQVDAALVVLGADPPVSDVELRVVVDLAAQVRDFVFVLNKADRSSAADFAEAAAFTTRVLERTLGRPCPLLEVSASERLSDRGATRDWAELETRLRDLAGGRRDALIGAAEERAVKRLAERLTHELDERIGALTRPLAETDARVARLRAAVNDVERALADLSHLFSAAEVDLARRFEAMRELFLATAEPGLAGALDRWMADEHRRLSAGRLRASALAQARDEAQRAIDDWRRAIEPDAEALYDAATARFVDLANQCLARLAVDGQVGRLAVEPGFHERRHFYFASLMSLTAGGPVSWVWDRLLPRPRSRGRVLRSAQEYGAHLLRSNAMRVEFDLRERVLGSRRWLERAVRQRLVEAMSTAERASREAQLHLAEGEDRVRDRLATLHQLREDVDHVWAQAIRGHDEGSGSA